MQFTLLGYHDESFYRCDQFDKKGPIFSTNLMWSWWWREKGLVSPKSTLSPNIGLAKGPRFAFFLLQTAHQYDHSDVLWQWKVVLRARWIIFQIWKIHQHIWWQTRRRKLLRISLLSVTNLSYWCVLHFWLISICKTNSFVNFFYRFCVKILYLFHFFYIGPNHFHKNE